MAWILFTRTPGLTADALISALERTGGAPQLLSRGAAELRALGLPAAASEFLASHAMRAPAQQLLATRLNHAEHRWLEQGEHAGQSLLTCTDSKFPPLLRQLRDCPVALYVDGRAESLADAQIAVVGSRNPTPSGRETAFEFARSLGRAGFCITSGLAEGIDAAAHRGALAADGVTIAVLGTGIDTVYPAHHARLAQEISASGGVLVSEFPPGTPARRANFPQRNRLIAALSLGTVVIEAAQRSGSLITARLAGEAGRDVFAVPGSIHNPLAHGCHQLIRQGAKLTASINDILTELQPDLIRACFESPAHEAGEARASSAPIDKNREILLDALDFEPAGVDTLAVRTGLKCEEISAQLLLLELEGQVTSAPGGRFLRR